MPWTLCIPASHATKRWQLLPDPRLTEAQFLRLCQANPDMRIERTAEGAIVIMPPTGTETGARNSELTYQLHAWWRGRREGRVYDSSTAFTLPNGAIRSPDASWLSPERLAGLTPEERRGFSRVCPDFVVELRSPSDRLADLQDKLREYIVNGARLGWLVDPQLRRVHVYRPDRVVELLTDPPEVRGDPELPGMVLDLTEVWGEAG